jgi:hypothetical protein
MLDNGYLNEVIQILPITVLLKGYLLINTYIDSLEKLAIDSIMQTGDKSLLSEFYASNILKNLRQQYRKEFPFKKLPDFSDLIKTMYYSSSFHEAKRTKMEQAVLAYLQESEIRTAILLKELSYDFQIEFFNFLDTQINQK